MEAAAFKTEVHWLREVDSLALCNVELNLKSAFHRFFRDKHNGYQKFKNRKNPVQSYTTNIQKGTIRITADSKYVRISKLGVRIKLHRQIPEGHTIKSATISSSSVGRYHISILTHYETDVKPKVPHLEKVLGLNYSSKALYIDHTNTSANYPKFYAKWRFG